MKVTLTSNYSPVEKKETIDNKFHSLVERLTGSKVTSETPKIDIRRKILSIEKMMEDSVADGKMIDTNPSFPLKHYFTDGVYARELTIPAGNLVVGKIHKHEHLNFISKGRVSVITEEGGAEILEGPCTIISPPGVKRLLFTHTDTVWTVVHATNEKDLDVIEEKVIAKKYTDIGLEHPVDILYIKEL